MNKVSLLCLAAIGLIVSCSDETTVFNDPQENTRIETSQQVLDNSIVYDNAGVLDINELNTITGKFSKATVDELAGDYPLTLIAQVNPPSFSGGANLTASDVHVEGDYAYVAYNTVDEEYVGGIDAINISDPNNPIVSSRVYFTNADINSVKYENGFVYAVGGVDAEKSVTATSNSFIAKIPITGGEFNISAGITYGFQQGFVSTDVETTTNTILVTSGMDGSLTVYDKNSVEIVNEIPFADLRSVALKDNLIAVLDGSSGISLLDQNLNLIREIGINTDFGIAKRTIDFSGDHIIVSEGSKGAGIYNYTTGTFLEYVPILINPEGVESGDIVTNAVAFNENILLMANGGAGLCLSEENGENTDIFGIIQLEGSINFVQSKGDYIFAASGKKGLQIVKMNKPSQSLEAICATLPIYEESANLNVNQGDDLAYRGNKRFNNVNVNGSLLLCGSWTVKNDTFVNSFALFEMNGTYVVGKNKKRKDIIIAEGATFRVEGNLTIYGDLILGDDTTLEFIGDNSVVNIFGTVTKSDSAEVIGNFEDIKSSF